MAGLANKKLLIFGDNNLNRQDTRLINALKWPLFTGCSVHNILELRTIRQRFGHQRGSMRDYSHLIVACFTQLVNLRHGGQTRALRSRTIGDLVSEMLAELERQLDNNPHMTMTILPPLKRFNNPSFSQDLRVFEVS